MTPQDEFLAELLPFLRSFAERHPQLTTGELITIIGGSLLWIAKQLEETLNAPDPKPSSTHQVRPRR